MDKFWANFWKQQLIAFFIGMGVIIIIIIVLGGILMNTLEKEYEEYLNEIGCPEHEHPENGGRVPFRMIDSYGTWLYLKDPIAFMVGFNEYKLEKVR